VHASSRSVRQGIRNLAIGCSVSLASLFAVLLGLEVGARSLGLKKGLFILYDQSCLRRSAALGFENDPGCRADNRRGAWLRINSFGLRGDEPRNDGSSRILAVGDSCTWGWGRTLNSETYPARLQALLDESHPIARYEVVNAGVPAYTSYQGLAYLRERGLALHPAITLIEFGFNDAVPIGDDEQRIRRQAAIVPIMRADDYLLERSTFYSWFRWHLEPPAPGKLAPRVSPEKFRKNLTEMIGLAREAGAKPMLLRLPRPTANQLAHLRVLDEVGRDLDVPVVSYEGPRIDPVHPTIDGYRMLAEQILARMEEEGFLRAPDLQTVSK
jgi:lysophospholipase L1-like esterase